MHPLSRWSTAGWLQLLQRALSARSRWNNGNLRSRRGDVARATSVSNEAVANFEVSKLNQFAGVMIGTYDLKPEISRENMAKKRVVATSRLRKRAPSVPGTATVFPSIEPERRARRYRFGLRTLTRPSSMSESSQHDFPASLPDWSSMRIGELAALACATMRTRSPRSRKMPPCIARSFM